MTFISIMPLLSSTILHNRTGFINLPYQHGRSDLVHRHSQNIYPMSQQTPELSQGFQVLIPKNLHKTRNIM